MLVWLNGRAADLSIILGEIEMELNSKQKGKLTEMQCLTAFIEQGCSVSIPYGDDSRYDFIADIDGQLLKIQVKTSSLKKGTSDAIAFSCRSTHVNCSGVKNIRYNKNEIDYFATYWNDEIFLIPVNECSAEKHLHLLPVERSNQTYAYDYKASEVLKKL